MVTFYQRRLVFNYWVSAIYIIFILFLTICLSQVIFLDIPLLTAFFGLRNYIFLLLLPHVMACTLTREQLITICSFILITAIPSAILVTIQQASAVDAFINRSVGSENQQKIFLVVKDVVRPYGFFSFTNGLAHYIGLLSSLFLVNLMLSTKDKFIKNPAT